MRLAIEAIHPLTLTQVELVGPDAISAEVRQVTGSLTGAVELSAAAEVWRHLIGWHDPLRSVVGRPEGKAPVRLVLSSVEPMIQHADWSALAAEGRRARELAVRDVERRRAGQVEVAPLHRVVLARVGADRYRMLWTVHGVIADRASCRWLFSEALRLLSGRRSGQPMPEPGTAPALEAIAAARRSVTGLLPPTATGWRPGTGIGSTTRRLPDALADGLAALAGSSGHSLRAVLMSAWLYVLARYAAVDEVSAAVLVGDRPEVLDAALDQSATLLDWTTSRGGDAAAEPAMLRGGAGSAAEVPCRFVLDDAVTDAAADLVVHEPTGGGVVVTVEHGRGVTVRAEYDADRVPSGHVERLILSYQILLDATVSRPDMPLGRQPLLDEDTGGAILHGLNNTARPRARDETVDRVFRRQSARWPDRVAVSAGSEELTYHELDRSSDALAHVLAQAGVRHGDRVGVCTRSAAELVVALLGVLKAGAAYVPLSNADPADRLATILEDCAAAHVVAPRELHAEQGGPLPPRITAIEPPAAGESAVEPADYSDGLTGDALIYVMYTSGSAGQPKGVAVPHRAVLRLVCGTDFVQLGPTDRVAQVSNPAFDATTFEVWGALCNGARLVDVPKEAVLQPAVLRDLVGREQVTTMFLTTALFNLVVDTAPGLLPMLRTLLFGGERVDVTRVRRALANPPERLLHVYGPTETTTFATWWEVRDVPHNAVTIPIGLPIANTTVHVLDESLRPVPAGVVGEICIGGDGVADGYFGRPALTSESFVDDPYSAWEGARLYVTGDLARRAPSGEIEFVGRRDHQVKLRGFRVEPGEVEVVLGGHESVREVRVIAGAGPAGAMRLVAYVVPERTAVVSEGDLRAFAKDRLPGYMIPAHFCLIAQLPLTRSGKLDRAALPAPTSTAAVSPATASAVGRTERIVQAAWRDALGEDRVGRHDNFFDIGGDSLLVAKITEKLAAELGRMVSIVDVFAHPTVAELAGHLDGEAASTGEVAAGALDRARLRAQRLGAAQPRTRPRLDADPGASGG